MNKSAFIFISVLLAIIVLRLYFFYSSKVTYRNGEAVNFTAVLSSEPKDYGSYQSFPLLLPNGETAFIKTDGYPEYSYGDKINIVGNLKFKLLNDNKSRIIALDFPKISLVKNYSGSKLAVIYYIRQKIINFFRNSLDKNSSSLMLGIVFGIKDDISKDFLNSLKTAGVMHVIAASGMNVTMTGGFVFYLFSMIFKRQTAVIFSILAILFYAFLAGFQASIIRASIMGIIAFSSQILGRQKSGIYALTITVFMMLFLWPNFLLDISFQLSVASTLGILFIPEVFKKWQNPFAQDFFTTVSAQIATLPIILSIFGTYSLWSVVANSLILWTVPFLMLIGGLAAITAFVFEPLARLLLYLSIPLLAYFQATAGFFASLKGSLFLESLPWQIYTAYYFLVISFGLVLIRKKHE